MNDRAARLGFWAFPRLLTCLNGPACFPAWCSSSSGDEGSPRGGGAAAKSPAASPAPLAAAALNDSPATYTLSGGAALLVRFGLCEVAGLGLHHLTPNVHYDPATKTACVFTGHLQVLAGCSLAGAWHGSHGSARSQQLVRPLPHAARGIHAGMHAPVKAACFAACVNLSHAPSLPTTPVSPFCVFPKQNLDELADRYSAEAFAEGPTSPSSILRASRGDPRQLAAETIQRMYMRERSGDLLVLLSELQVRQGGLRSNGCARREVTAGRLCALFLLQRPGARCSGRRQQRLASTACEHAC